MYIGSMEADMKSEQGPETLCRCGHERKFHGHRCEASGEDCNCQRFATTEEDEADALLSEAIAKSSHASDCSLRRHINARNAVYATNYAGIRGRHKRAAYQAKLLAEWEKDKPACDCWKARAKNFLAARGAFKEVPAYKPVELRYPVAGEILDPSQIGRR